MKKINDEELDKVTGGVSATYGKITVDEDKCTGCGSCKDLCPSGAIKIIDGKCVIDGFCFGCNTCVYGCPTGAMSLNQ